MGLSSFDLLNINSKKDENTWRALKSDWTYWNTSRSLWPHSGTSGLRVAIETAEIVFLFFLFFADLAPGGHVEECCAATWVQSSAVAGSKRIEVKRKAGGRQKREKQKWGRRREGREGEDNCMWKRRNLLGESWKRKTWRGKLKTEGGAQDGTETVGKLQQKNARENKKSWMWRQRRIITEKK